MIELLPRIIPCAPERPELAGPDHPMRKVTRRVAFEPDGVASEAAWGTGCVLRRARQPDGR